MSDEPEIIEEVEPAFEPYKVEIGDAVYTVLEPTEETSHRIQMPEGFVTGVPCADSSVELTSEDLGGHLDNPPSVSFARDTFTPLDLFDRLTQAEQLALVTSGDVAVQLVKFQFSTAGDIKPADPRTIAGKGLLVSKGVLTSDRADEIFQ